MNRLHGVAKRTWNDGFRFDSRLEGALYAHLKLRVHGGELQELVTKPNVYLTRARLLMIPDFKAFDVLRGCEVYFEAKGYETEVWRLKRRLWKVYGPGPLCVFKGSAKRLTLVEEIAPSG